MVSVRQVHLFYFRSFQLICITDKIKKIVHFNLDFLRSEHYGTEQIRNTKKFEKIKKYRKCGWI
jgi:hypothetical protein